MIGEAFNDKEDVGWINRINSIIKTGNNKVEVDIKLTGVTFDFRDENRQMNLAMISLINNATFALRKVGKTGLDVVAYEGKSYIGSVGWIPKEFARHLSKIINDINIKIEKYQIRGKHIIAEDPVFFDFPFNFPDEYLSEDSEDDLAKKMVLGMKIRLLIDIPIDISKLLIGENNV